MDRHRQPPPDSTHPATGPEEDSLRRPSPDPPVEGQRTDTAHDVEREGIGPEGDLPEREIIGPEEGRRERGNRSQESI